MRQLLTLLALLSLVASCTPPRLMEAPRPARHDYHHRQRTHERERRHRTPSAILWS